MRSRRVRVDSPSQGVRTWVASHTSGPVCVIERLAGCVRDTIGAGGNSASGTNASVIIVEMQREVQSRCSATVLKVEDVTALTHSRARERALRWAELGEVREGVANGDRDARRDVGPRYQVAQGY